MPRQGFGKVDEGVDPATEAREWMTATDLNSPENKVSITSRPTSPIWIQRWNGLVSFIQKLDQPWMWLSFPAWLPAAVLAVLVIIVRDIVQREKKIGKMS